MAEVPWHLVLDDIGRRAEALKRKKTNADRIRAMTDEELALYLDNMQGLAYINGFDSEPIRLYPNNYGAWLDWLKEADNGEKEEKA